MITPNRSSAVMQQRAEPADSLDYFPTPPWATRALCLFLRDTLGQQLDQLTCWEPACGEMHMARPLAEYFGRVEATDVHRYTPDHGIADFLMPMAARQVDWIVTNPPFQLGHQFITAALARARTGAAMLVRSAFTESEERWPLFRDLPPSYAVQFVERVVMLKGRLIQANAPDPFNVKDGKPVKASTATSYCWLIWQPGQRDTRHRWIPPCRRQLERDGDYPAYADQWAKIRPATEGNLL